jgi:hypothetical protein
MIAPPSGESGVFHDTSIRPPLHAQRAVLDGVGREFVQRQAQGLRGFEIEHDVRA